MPSIRSNRKIEAKCRGFGGSCRFCGFRHNVLAVQFQHVVGLLSRRFFVLATGLLTTILVGLGNPKVYGLGYARDRWNAID